MGQKSSKPCNNWEMVPNSHIPVSNFEPTNSVAPLSESANFSSSTILPSNIQDPVESTMKNNGCLSKTISKSLTSIDLKCQNKLSNNSAVPSISNAKWSSVGNLQDSSSSEDESGIEMGDRRFDFHSIKIEKVSGEVIFGNVFRQISNQDSSLGSCFSESDLEEMLKAIKAKLLKSYQSEAYVPNHRRMSVSPKDPLHLSGCLNVHLSTKSHTTKQESEQPVSIQYLGSLLQSHKTILLEGHLGYGKSIVSKQLIYNWTCKSVESLNYFQLVYIIKAEEFDNTVMEFLIQKSCIEGYDDKDLFLAVLKKYQDHILIIIDGYDQMKSVQQEQVQQLIKGKVLPHSSVFVTSRPEAAASIFRLFKFHLRTCGFDTGDIMKYAKSFLGSDSYRKLCDVLPSEVLEFYVYLQCPFYLFLQCSEWKEKSCESVPTYTDLVSHVVKEAICHCLQLNEMKCEAVLDCLGVFCLGLIEKRQIEFSWIEIKHCLHNVVEDIDDKRSLGLLRYTEIEQNEIMCTEIGSRYQFIHPAFIELITANYLFKTSDKDKHCSRLKNVLQRLKDTETLLPAFMAGLIKNTNSEFFSSLISCYLYDRFLYHIHLLIQSGNFPENIEIVCGYLSEWLVLNFSQPYSTVASDEADVSRFMHSEINLLSSRDVFLVNISLWGKMISDVISHTSCPIKTLILSIDSKSAVSCVRNIISRLNYNSKISSLIMYSSELSLSELLQDLSNCKSIKLLSLTLQTLDSSKFFKELEKCPPFNNHLESFSFVISHTSSDKSTPLTSDQLKTLSLFLLRCQNLHHLKFHVNNRSRKSMLIISELLHKLTITHLALTLEQTKQNVLKPLCEYLKKTTCTLNTLDFSHSQLSEKDVCELIKAISSSDCPLTSLSLAYCIPTTHKMLTISLNSLIPSTKQWNFMNLSGCKLQYRAGNEHGTVNHMVLDDCELDGISIHKMVTLFQVKKLQCPFTEFLDPDVSIDCSSSLQSLWLEKPNINGKSLEAVCNQVLAIDSLKELRISLEIDNTMNTAWNAPWSSLMTGSALSKIHLNVNCSSSNEDYDKTGDIFFEIVCNTLKESECLEHLILSVFTEQFWQKKLNLLLSEINQAFVNQKLCIFEIILDEKHFHDMLSIIEEWNLNNNDELFKVVTEYLPGKKNCIQFNKLISKS